MGLLTSQLAILWFTSVLVVAVLSLVRFSWKAPLIIMIVGFGILFGALKLTSIPLPTDIRLPEASVLLDRDGRTIATLSEVTRFIIDTSELPPFVSEAVIAAEDRSFYEHGGVSYRGVLRAAWADLRGMALEQGGSTITQQYVKNALLQDSSRSFLRKLNEVVLATKLEDRYSKEDILGFYLNTIYWGRGAYGIEAAARAYYDKPATKLTLEEAAFLAGIIRAPEAYQPDEHPEVAMERRASVLEAMVEEGFIEEDDAAVARARPLGTIARIQADSTAQTAAYFTEWVRERYLIPEFGECLYTCGLTIHTTLDLDMQGFAERSIAKVLTKETDPQAALVSMTPRGEVRALVGGKDFESRVAATGFNFGTDFPGRHAGSALKPFTLLAALEEGTSPYAAYSGSSPQTIESASCASGKHSWTVENYGGASYGTMSLDQATVSSVNTIYARLISDIGPRLVADLLTDFGFDRHGTTGERAIPAYCSLALGALDVTPLEMSRAYAAFASGGLLPRVTPISYVEDAGGNCLISFVSNITDCEKVVPAERTRVADASSIQSLNATLHRVVTSGTATGANVTALAAGKTGTSQHNRDSWFSGYVPQLATTVWMGYPAERDGSLVPEMRTCGNAVRCRPVRGLDVTGGTLPAEIWGRYMTKAMTELDKDRNRSDGNGDRYQSVPDEEHDPHPATLAPDPTPEASDPPKPAPAPSPSDDGGLIHLPTPLPTPP